MSRRFPGGFPFGGMGGGFPGMEQPEPKEKDYKLYEILGVEKNATEQEIKKAYKKKAIRLHPDKGGDPEKFKELAEAAEILGNAEKRELYDQYGMEGVQSGGRGGGGGGMDIFEAMFGGGGMGGGGPQKARKGKPVLKELRVKLEDIYNGKMFKVPHSRKKLCDDCDGKGGANQRKCGECKGRGVIEKMVMLGPGMYQQSQQHCGTCKGEGKIVDEKDKCKSCKGKKISEQKKTLEVALEAGCPEEHDIYLHGESDEAPGISPGDMVFRVMIEKHKVFTRKGADLFVDKKITLLEALTGFNFEIKLLDNSMLKISTLPGEVISSGDVKVVKGKGLPFYKDAMGHGNLYLKFEIEFPKKGQLDSSKLEKLANILPGEKHTPLQKGEKAEYLDDFDESDLNPSEEGGRGRRGHQHDDDDDEQGGQGQRVQCNQQ